MKELRTEDLFVTFLIGLRDRSSPLRILRGHGDVLKIIWTFACEEWWNFHIQWFIPKLYRYRGMNMRNVTGVSLKAHQVRSDDYIPDLTSVRGALVQEWKEPTNADFVFSGCPMAVIARDVTFPSPLSDSLDPSSSIHQVDNRFCINMMPFDLSKPHKTLPDWCHGYIPMIELCASYMKKPWDVGRTTPVDSQTAFLTIDERTVQAGETHRRKGLHVEAPIWSQSTGVAPVSLHWGGGPIRASRIHGGIFCASNVANTTAVWNCQLHDPQAHVIRRHGSIEHCRRLLGKPSKLLQAGEIIWMTDHTPHESLPMPYTSQRQFFRLVVGNVSAWFTEHNTPNPLGYQPNTHDPEMQLIRTNKYVLCQELIPQTSWDIGTPSQLLRMKEWKIFCHMLHLFEVGHMMERFYSKGIMSIHDFLRASDGLDLWTAAVGTAETQTDDASALYQRISEMDMLEYMLQEMQKVENIWKLHAVLSPDCIQTLQYIEFIKKNTATNKNNPAVHVLDVSLNYQKHNIFKHMFYLLLYYLVGIVKKLGK